MEFESREFEDLTSKEWLVTNGIGGYASSTLCGSNTRKYHGVLVASFNPPTERLVMVSKVEEAIFVDGKEIKLSTNEYPGVIYPEGYKLLNSFERVPLPSFVFRYKEAQLTKTV